jgi:hypothetical protein
MRERQAYSSPRAPRTALYLITGVLDEEQGYGPKSGVERSQVVHDPRSGQVSAREPPLRRERIRN